MIEDSITIGDLKVVKKIYENGDVKYISKIAEKITVRDNMIVLFAIMIISWKRAFNIPIE